MSLTDATAVVCDARRMNLAELDGHRTYTRVATRNRVFNLEARNGAILLGYAKEPCGAEGFVQLRFQRRRFGEKALSNNEGISAWLRPKDCWLPRRFNIGFGDAIMPEGRMVQIKGYPGPVMAR